MKIKPLLAAKVELDKLQYPVYASPKLDGIRCLMVNGVAMSRSMKPIPNKFVQAELAELHGLDGELMVNGDYNDVQSAIMSRDGEPDFTYYVFDSFDNPNHAYKLRHALLYESDAYWDSRVQILENTIITDEESLLEYLEQCLTQGYEGVMIRDPISPYKFGRSTVKQATLLKMKKFLDDEAMLIEITEKMHNANELEQDELGYAKRSSHKENLVPADTAGSCILKLSNGVEFRVGFGPGWTDEKKQYLWDNRRDNIGRMVTYRYQELSKDGVPRFGKLVGFRHPNDL